MLNCNCINSGVNWYHDILGSYFFQNVKEGLLSGRSHEGKEIAGTLPGWLGERSKIPEHEQGAICMEVWKVVKLNKGSTLMQHGPS